MPRSLFGAFPNGFSLANLDTTFRLVDPFHRRSFLDGITSSVGRAAPGFPDEIRQPLPTIRVTESAKSVGKSTGHFYLSAQKRQFFAESSHTVERALLLESWQAPCNLPERDPRRRSPTVG